MVLRETAALEQLSELRGTNTRGHDGKPTYMQCKGSRDSTTSSKPSHQPTTTAATTTTTTTTTMPS